MASARNQAGASSSQTESSSKQGRPLTRGLRPLIYELFVLGELMVQPMYDSFLHETARRILGPFHPLSWGIISPLIRRLEQQGLVTSVAEKRRGGWSPLGRGQPPRIYAITPAGHHIERPLNLPQSLRRPHPPILIAGGGEQKTLRLVARYADACNLRPGPEIPKKLDSRLCCTWGPAGILGTPHHSCRHRRRTVRAVAGREYLRSVRPHAPCLGDRSGRPPLCHSGRPAGDHCARRRRRPQHGGQHHLPSGNPGGPRRRPGAAGDTHCTSSTGAPHVGLTRKMRRSMFQ